MQGGFPQLARHLDDMAGNDGADSGEAFGIGQYRAPAMPIAVMAASMSVPSTPMIDGCWKVSPAAQTVNNASATTGPAGMREELEALFMVFTLSL